MLPTILAPHVATGSENFRFCKPPFALAPNFGPVSSDFHHADSHRCNAKRQLPKAVHPALAPKLDVFETIKGIQFLQKKVSSSSSFTFSSASKNLTIWVSCYTEVAILMKPPTRSITVQLISYLPCLAPLNRSIVNVLKGKIWDEASQFDEEKDKSQFRNYEEACDRVKNFYKEQHGLWRFLALILIY